MARFDIAVQLHTPQWKPLLKPYCKTVRLACTAALAATGLATLPCRWEMTVVLADDALLRQLNRDFRGKDKPTNVLSFPSESDLEKQLQKFTTGSTRYFIGDIVLALETIEREALEQDKEFKQHVIHLLVHGALHLTGHDHEREEEAACMESKEIAILNTLGIENPYL